MPVTAGVARAGAPLEFAVIIFEDECKVRVTGSPNSTVGDDVDWFNAIAGLQSIDEVSADLWSHEMEPGQTYHGSAAAAGSFRQPCQDGPITNWRVKMKAPEEPVGSVLHRSMGLLRNAILLAIPRRGEAGDRGLARVEGRDLVEVRRVPGRAGNVYRLRSRVINADTDAMSGWSPPAVVQT
jgi:hypothetical protein